MELDNKQSVGEYNLKTALMDFEKLKQENSLPAKMAIKLQYLENKILNRPIVNEEYKLLPEYELESLEQCDKQSQAMLFVSIVKCLSGKEVIVYFTNTKAYIKKEETLSIWKKCYISCDSAYLYVKKKANKKTNYYEFKIRLLKVSKKYLEYKGRLCFGLLYENKKYMLGFQHETACERIFKTLKQLAKQNHPELSNIKPLSTAKSQPLLYQNSQPSDKFESVVGHNLNGNQNFPKSSTNNNINGGKGVYQEKGKELQRLSSKAGSVLEFQQEEGVNESSVKQVKEEQIFEAIREEIRRENVGSDTNFKLVKNLELGRLLVFNGASEEQAREAKTKTSMILSMKQTKVDYAWLLEQYLAMNSWNLEVEESRIINKISDNSYKIYLQFKRYSILSLTRWAVAIATALIIDKKVYLLIRSCDELTEEELILGNYMSTVRMKKFDQTIEICQRTEKDDKVLMTVLTTADFGGYCSKTDNLNMSLHLLNNINNFYNFLITQGIAKAHSQNPAPLFQLAVKSASSINTPTKSQSQFTNSSMCPSDVFTVPKRKQSYNSSEMSLDDGDDAFQDQQEQKIMDFGKKNKSFMLHQNLNTTTNNNNKSVSSKQVEDIIYNDFMSEFAAFQLNGRGTQKLVQFIQSKVQQRYYLKQKFIQNPTFDPHAPKYNNDPASDNWLLQKGKWRISGMELVFTNEQILAQQKNVIKLILKQLSSNVMAGKNIMNMSLPVEIFEDKSFLQKLGQVYGLLPYYCNLAAKEKNIVKQIVYVTQGIAYATTICPNIEKPFNPILGETYQCKIGGVSVSFEQISYHPPISAYYIKSDEYECWGFHNPLVEMGLNTAVAKNLNPISVHFFQTNTRYSGYGQDFEIGGLLFGQRTYKNSGRVNVFEQTNQILCELSYGKNKKNIYESQKKLKTGQIIGGVYKVSHAFTKRFKHAQWKHFQGIKYDEKIQELAKITGNWMGDFCVDGVKMRGLYDVVPSKPVKETVVLPSDCSFRLDVYYKKMGDIKKAQEWKQVMENQQRKDRKLREEYGGKQHSKKH